MTRPSKGRNHPCPHGDEPDMEGHAWEPHSHEVPESSDSRTQRVDGGAGAGGVGGVCASQGQGLCVRDGTFWKGWWGWLHNVPRTVCLHIMKMVNFRCIFTQEKREKRGGCQTLVWLKRRRHILPFNPHARVAEVKMENQGHKEEGPPVTKGQTPRGWLGAPGTLTLQRAWCEEGGRPRRTLCTCPQPVTLFHRTSRSAPRPGPRRLHVAMRGGAPQLPAPTKQPAPTFPSSW